MRDERSIQREKNVSNQKKRLTNCHIMIRKNPYGRIIRTKVQNLTRVFNYLHDSNSIFRPAGNNSELLKAHTAKSQIKSFS